MDADPGPVSRIILIFFFLKSCDKAFLTVLFSSVDRGLNSVNAFWLN